MNHDIGPRRVGVCEWHATDKIDTNSQDTHTRNQIQCTTEKIFIPFTSKKMISTAKQQEEEEENISLSFGIRLLHSPFYECRQCGDMRYRATP